MLHFTEFKSSLQHHLIVELVTLLTRYTFAKHFKT